jgi:hypothetical protein
MGKDVSFVLGSRIYPEEKPTVTSSDVEFTKNCEQNREEVSE